MMDVELNHLTEAERDAIFSVLRRDEDLREKEFERIRKLRNEIKRIKYKGVIKAGHDPNKTCARCREEFGWLFNKGAICTHCSHKVCDKCREYTKTGSWLCILCFKQKELEMMSGNWFYMRFRKSKRNRRTNKVVSGPEIVRASMRRNARYNGGIRERDHSEVSHSPAADVKKALQNNNASPKSLKSAGSAEDDQNSDTQSMETGMSPNKRKSDIHEVGFPKESDKQKLLDLIRPKSRSSDEEQPQVQVRRIVSHGFTDSDSSSSDEAASPNLSVRTNNIDKESGFGQMDSLRGSMRSTSGISIVSSEGRITIVTEANVSDYDIESLQSTQSISSIQDTSSIGPTNSQSVTPKLNPKFVHQEQAVIHNSNRPTKSMSLSPDIKSRNPHNEDVPDNMGYTLKVHQVSTKKRQDSLSSESEDDDKVESLNSVKFHKVSNRPRSRSPSPDPKFGQPHHDETLGQQDVPHSNGSLVVRAQHSHESEVDPSVISGDTVSAGMPSPQHYEHKPSDSSSTSSVPLITQQEQAQQQSSQSNRGSDAPQEVKEEKEEEDNIDDLFATHASSSRSHTPSHSTSQRSTNLLSPFSESRESIVSYYSDAGEGNYGNIAITGDIQFGLEYNYKTGIMQVRMKQCRDLAPVDTKRKRSDPYIKTYLLPDKTKSGKRKTKVKKHTLNPVFDEVLKYSITKSELETRTLWVTVWHNDTFGRNDFLGEVTMPLDYYNFDEPSPKWYKLQERNASPMSLLTYKGDLILSIKYVTADNLNKKSGGKSRQGHGELHCLVKEASNLTAVRANGTSDPFCKAYLLPDKTKKQKTQFIKNDCNPQWNHTFVWEDISLDDLPDRALELTVWDHDRFTSNDFLGAVRLNLGLGKSAGKIVDWMDAKGEEISLWQAMLDRPNCWTDGSLMLRPNMDKRK